MGILDIMNMYRDKYSYTCEKCGKKVPFMQDFCGHCGSEVPAKYRLNITLKTYNLNDDIWEKVKRYSPKLQGQLCERLKSCQTQAEANALMLKYIKQIEAKRKGV